MNVFSNLRHLLHLDALGMDKTHRSYILEIQEGAIIHLLCADGTPESDEKILTALDDYVLGAPFTPSDGKHYLDYDVRNNTFHGLGTRHQYRKYKLLRDEAEEPLIQDPRGNVVGDHAVIDAVSSVLEQVNLEDLGIPDSGCQFDFDPVVGRIRGLENFTAADEATAPAPGSSQESNPAPEFRPGGGDFSGSGASGEWTETSGTGPESEASEPQGGPTADAQCQPETATNTDSADNESDSDN